MCSRGNTFKANRIDSKDNWSSPVRGWRKSNCIAPFFVFEKGDCVRVEKAAGSHTRRLDEAGGMVV